jgi:hypothetical protein
MRNLFISLFILYTRLYCTLYGRVYSSLYYGYIDAPLYKVIQRSIGTRQLFPKPWIYRRPIKQG